MGVIVRKDVDPLPPHGLDQVLENHGLVKDGVDPLCDRLLAAGELDHRDCVLPDLKLGLDGGGAQSDERPVLVHGAVRAK